MSLLRRSIARHASRVASFAAMLVLVAGCTKSLDTPPELRADKVACTRCRMLISDTRFACALKLDRYLLFDDIGCMLDYSRTHASTREASTGPQVWVRDFENDAWIHAQDAHFFATKDRKTPMGYGYIAINAKSNAVAPAGATLIGSINELQTQFASHE